MKAAQRFSLSFITLACATTPAAAPAAPFQEIPIAVVAGTDQQLPTVSGNWIAWQDDRATPIIHGVRAENRTTGVEHWVSPVPNTGAYHGHPRLSGDTILWQGNPNVQGTLFYDDLSAAGGGQKVFNQSIHQYAGDIHDDLVVWHEAATDPLTTGDLYGSYLGSNSKFPISTSGKVHIEPVTDGRFVVFREYVNPGLLNLFVKDLQTNVTSLLHPAGPNAEIDDGVVVFGTLDGIHVRNLITNQSTTIPTAVPFSVAISGDLVVYSNISPGKSDYDLWGFRLENGQPFLISDAPGNQYWADVHGNFVVWTDDRSGNLDVYGAWVPEPGTFALVGLALVCGLPIRRRR